MLQEPLEVAIPTPVGTARGIYYHVDGARSGLILVAPPTSERTPELRAIAEQLAATLQALGVSTLRLPGEATDRDPASALEALGAARVLYARGVRRMAWVLPQQCAATLFEEDASTALLDATLASLATDDSDDSDDSDNAVGASASIEHAVRTAQLFLTNIRSVLGAVAGVAAMVPAPVALAAHGGTPTDTYTPRAWLSFPPTAPMPPGQAGQAAGVAEFREALARWSSARLLGADLSWDELEMRALQIRALQASASQRSAQTIAAHNAAVERRGKAFRLSLFWLDQQWEQTLAALARRDGERGACLIAATHDDTEERIGYAVRAARHVWHDLDAQAQHDWLSACSHVYRACQRHPDARLDSPQA